ncbi:hypothetical protein YK48G_06170 [Lentilactobacillus fungorum]|uniref:DUF2975 domain-containing protein n=1 Tax=Lentilactobacillus fungorum TaxID=2201250 RepID=A0ABQ3VWB9_9LACO|nr:hypothetical protein [Lentilactobacillus fungorum]GHP13192.1 hypothetical protein YK48G_06170 [Lentilactobacillus fungorum]
MTNKRANSFLTIIYVISVIILASLVVGFCTLTVIFLIAGIVFLVNPSARISILKDSPTGIGNLNNPWGFWLAILLILFLLAMLVVIAWAVSKLIQNVRNNIFFETSTLNYIRCILWGYGAIIVLSLFGSLFDLNISLGDSSGAISLLMWFAVYAIYIMFKYGIQLQDDSNKIV